MSHFFPHAADPERAELMACRSVVELAKDQGVTKLVLETDCVGAISKLSGKELDRSVHGPLVEEIKCLLMGFDEFPVKHVRRTGNVVAHRLAKEGCENKMCNAWLESPPSWLMNLLDSDLSV